MQCNAIRLTQITLRLDPCILEDIRQHKSCWFRGCSVTFLFRMYCQQVGICIWGFHIKCQIWSVAFHLRSNAKVKI